jgi:hypothetical protein
VLSLHYQLGPFFSSAQCLAVCCPLVPPGSSISSSCLWLLLLLQVVARRAGMCSRCTTSWALR